MIFIWGKTKKIKIKEEKSKFQKIKWTGISENVKP